MLQWQEGCRSSTTPRCLPSQRSSQTYPTYPSSSSSRASNGSTATSSRPRITSYRPTWASRKASTLTLWSGRILRPLQLTQTKPESIPTRSCSPWAKASSFLLRKKELSTRPSLLWRSGFSARAKSRSEICPSMSTSRRPNRAMTSCWARIWDLPRRRFFKPKITTSSFSNNNSRCSNKQLRSSTLLTKEIRRTESI